MSVICGPVFTTDDEYITAAEELADFCGYPVEEMFPSLAPYLSRHNVKRLRQVAPKNRSIRIARENFIDLLNYPEFITLDKYMLGATIIPNECGRLYGCRVIICDDMPPSQIAMVSEVIYK